MRGLYAIVDTDALADVGRRGGAEIGPVAFAEAILDARPAAIQLRDKRGDAVHTLELLRSIAPLAARAGVPFFANDRPDLAAFAGCDGVHLGQDDVPLSVARGLRDAGGRALRVGVSTHDAPQVDAALADAPDYIAMGPVFPTRSKERPSAELGLAGLASLVARARAARPATPLVAIGGVSAETAAFVGALVDAVAVIGALLPGESEENPGHALDLVRDRARTLYRAIFEVAP